MRLTKEAQSLVENNNYMVFKRKYIITDALNFQNSLKDYKIDLIADIICIEKEEQIHINIVLYQ